MALLATLSGFKSRLLRALNIVYWLELSYCALVKLKLRRCGRRLRLKLTTVILGHENIVLGNNFSSMGTLYLYANEGYLQVGDNCSLNTNVQLGASAGRLVIGDNVAIAANVVIRVANSGMRRDSPMKSQPHIRGEIIIEDDVWIGSNAVVTPGVTLAKGTVVGAGAVVTKSTEPYSIVAGVPAKKIGERV